MKTQLTIGGLISLVVVILGIFLFQGVNSCSNNNKVIDTLAAKAHTEQIVMRDTITKYDTIKQKAEIVYKTKHDTLWKMKPDSIDTVFNKTFPRDTLDSSGYLAGYTQLRKAIDANNRSIRDSTKETASVAQVAVCTTTVTKIVNQIDTAKTQIKSYNAGWQTIAAGVLVAALSLFVGFAAR
jgi:hypothetical protein